MDSVKISEMTAAYRRHSAGRLRILLLTAAVMLLAFFASLGAGSAGLEAGDIALALIGRGTRESSAIIQNVRLPRAATAAAVGAALSICGCVMQNVMSNPLASASTLGVSQGASFGAAVAIVRFGAGVQFNAGGSTPPLTITNPYMVTLCAFAGGIATTALILALSRLRGCTTQVLVLAGVAISSMFTGGVALVQYFADDVAVASVVYWTFGSLSRAGWREIALISLLSLAAFCFFFFNRWSFNAIESGINTAKSLGTPVESLIPLSMAICALVCSAAVAFTGCISFIGLIAPHIMRRFVGSDFRLLLPCSALCGSALLLLSDIASRLAAAPAVLPIGALTSFLGAPLFLWLIMRRGSIK